MLKDQSELSAPSGVPVTDQDEFSVTPSQRLALAGIQEIIHDLILAHTKFRKLRVFQDVDKDMFKEGHEFSLCILDAYLELFSIFEHMKSVHIQSLIKTV